jgi:YVTN family beta-propeller protein
MAQLNTHPLVSHHSKRINQPMRLKAIAFLLIAVLLMASISFTGAQEGALTLTPLGTYETGIFDDGAAEIGAYDPASQRLFIINAAATTLDILNVADPTNLVLVSEIDLSAYGDSANSVAVFEGLVAVAVQAEAVDGAGQVVFVDVDGNLLNSVAVGVLPDMVTFTPDGSKVLTANEGEPNEDYTVDPEGSVAVIDISGGVEALTQDQVTLIGFSEAPEGVRIFGPNATVAQDIEPEYIAVSPDSSTAYVTLQENNAVAVIDLGSNSLSAIVPLGVKDHSVEGNGFDASDEDGMINITTHPVFGFYLPDAITAFEANGSLYLITANEGDAREYIIEENDQVVAGYSEQTRVEDLALDETAFPNAAELQAAENLGRLRVTIANGDTDGDGDFDQLYTYGTRSFTVWGADGSLVYDSGDFLEQKLAELLPDYFNSDGDNDSFDSRSDDKGPEPEGVTVGMVNGVQYVFVGLERIGGVMVFDLSDPTAPAYVTYANNRDWMGVAEEGTAGDLSPEGLVFIAAEDSPTGGALLVVMNEYSGSTTVWAIE